MSTPGLRVLTATNPSAMTLDGTRTYLVGFERPAIIDPGPACPTHLQMVVEALESAAPQAIIVTHSHPDHAGGAEALAARVGAPIITRPGSVVETDSGRLELIATPGHARDHIVVRWTEGDAPREGAVFVGDLLMGEGDTTLVAPPEGNLAEYLGSLSRLDALGPAVLFPAHGPPLSDPRAAIERYRDHRMERLAQVGAAIRHLGDVPPAELVREVYGEGLPPELQEAAEGSIRAILEYLSSR